MNLLYPSSSRFRSKTACPVGWHLPSDAEWQQLEIYLGMDPSVANTTDWRGTDQGNQLKSTTLWTAGGSATNSSGFTALPGVRVGRSAVSAFTVTGGRLQRSAQVHGDVTWTTFTLLFTGIRTIRALVTPSAA